MRRVLEVWDCIASRHVDALQSACAELIAMHTDGILPVGIVTAFSRALADEGYPKPCLSLAESTISRLAIERAAGR